MTLREKIAGLVILLASLGAGFFIYSQNRQIALLRGQLDQQFRHRATELLVTTPSVKPTIKNEGLTKNNSNVVKELQKADPGAKIVEVVETHAAVQDKPEGEKLNDGTMWQDAHKRFTLNLTSLDFSRRQEFKVNLVVVQSSHGTKVLNQDFQELDPETHSPIEGEPPPTLLTSWTVVKEPSPAPPVFHPRVVAGVGYLGQVGLGVEFLNGERFGGILEHTNLSLLGLYDTQKKAGTGVVMLGYRPFNWNLSIGPAYFFPGNKLGAAATLELTR